MGRSVHVTQSRPARAIHINTFKLLRHGQGITSVIDALHCCINKWGRSTIWVQVNHVNAGLVSSVVVHESTAARQVRVLARAYCAHQASPSFTLTFAGFGLAEPFSDLSGSPPVAGCVPARPLISTFRFMASTAPGDRSFAMTYLACRLSPLVQNPHTYILDERDFLGIADGP